MKKIIATLLALTLVAGTLCACNQSADNEDKDDEQQLNYSVKADIIEAYDLSEEDIKRVNRLFSDLDDAFSDLANVNDISDEDFAEYASDVESLISEFESTINWDTVNEKISSETDTNKIDAFSLIFAQQNKLALFALSLSTNNYSYTTGENSGEKCAEVAINYVNEYAQFFLGESLITDEDLDKFE